MKIIAETQIHLPFPEGLGIALTPGAHASYLTIQAKGASEQEARDLLQAKLGQLAEIFSQSAQRSSI